MDFFSIITLLGGLAFFLFGMNMLSGGLERMAGGKLEGVGTNDVIYVHSTAGSVANITGGEFEPLYGYDGSSVYLTNGTNDIEFSVTGGTFNTKIGVADASKAGVKGSVSGGTFSEPAKTATNPALIAEGYDFVSNGDGTYTVMFNQSSVGVTDEKAKPHLEALGRKH